MHVSTKTAWRPHFRSKKTSNGREKAQPQKPERREKEKPPVVLTELERYQEKLRQMATRPGQPSLQTS